MHLQDISKEQTELLAIVFCCPPSESQARHVERIWSNEAQMDNQLLRPGFLHRLIQLPQSYYADLCTFHKMLNAKVVRQIFIAIATEVGVRMNRIVVAGRDKVGHETWDRSILNLRSLHGAWLSPEVFWDTFGETLDVVPDGFSNEDYMTKWVKDSERCEACILTRIASDLDTVLDLDMIVRSRTHTRSVKHYREPRLRKLIDAWLRILRSSYDQSKWEQKLEWNQLRASRLKEVRRELRRQRRKAASSIERSASTGSGRRRPAISAPIIEHDSKAPAKQRDRHQSQTRLPQAGQHSEISDDEDDDKDVRKAVDDAENEVIDAYGALISTPFLPDMSAKEHQDRARRLSQYSVPSVDMNSKTGWPMTGTQGGAGNVGRSKSVTHRSASAYSASVYSQSQKTPLKSPPGPHHYQPSFDALKRSNTVQEKSRNDNSSWVDASVPPTPFTPGESTARQLRNVRGHRHNNKFESIEEEAAARHSPRHPKYEPVSPIKEDEKVKLRDTGKAALLDDNDSPVSPILPPPDFPATTKSRASNSMQQGKRAYQSKFRENLDALNDEYEASRSNSSSSRPKETSRNESHSSHPQLKSRLSQPFDGPADPNTVMESVRRMRELQTPRQPPSKVTTAKSDVTHWSDIYKGNGDTFEEYEERVRKEQRRRLR